MDVASALLEHAEASGRRSIVVVGTGKNVGKTVTARALARAAAARGATIGFTSAGRDGEPVDMATSARKPRLPFAAGALLATASDALRGSPAVEVLELWEGGGPLGRTAIVRVATPAAYAIAGPHTAAGIRAVIERMAQLGAAPIIVDGSVDRMAALAGGDDAVIVACGAARGGSLAHIVEEVRAAVARLSLPLARAGEGIVHLGALTEAHLEAFIAARETRPIAIEDATKLFARPRLILRARAALDLRVQRAISVIACTVSAIDAERSYDVRALLDAVRAATGVPAYDLFSGESAA